MSITGALVLEGLTDLMGIDASGWETVREACSVVKIAGINEQQIDILLLHPDRYDVSHTFYYILKIRTRASCFMCVTNDAKSPKSPLAKLHREQTRPWARLTTIPVVRLGLGKLLVAEQPAVAVGGGDDVHVSPLQRARRGREGHLGELALVHVRVALFAGARERGGAEREESEERRGEQHGQEGQGRGRLRERRRPRARGYIYDAPMCARRLIG